MATPLEVSAVIEYCEDRWPGTRNFRHAERAAWDFQHIPAAAIHQAAQDHYNAGERNAPTLSQLRSVSARIAAERGLTDPTASDCSIRGKHSRSWAIEMLDDGKRSAMCLDCGLTVIRDAQALLTVGEARAAAEAQRLQSPPADLDELADRIAP